MKKRTIYSRFKETVGKYPDNRAFIEDGRIISYKKLDTMVNSIPSRFYSSEPKMVGIVMRHGAEQNRPSHTSGSSGHPKGVIVEKMAV